MDPPALHAGPLAGVMAGIGSQTAAANPTPVGGPGSVIVASGIQSGILISKVDPIYPQLARQARIGGVVTLAAQISREGEVMNLQLISGHPMLVSAAIDAVKQWNKPYLVFGTPVEVNTQVQVNFILSNE